MENRSGTMNIIAQDGAVVNIYAAENVNLITAKRLAKAKIKREERKEEEKKPILARWQDHKRDAMLVADRLYEIGLYKRGFNIRMCGQDLVFSRCSDCGHIEIKEAQLCRDRLCPVCNWRLSIKRYAKMSAIMSACYSRRPDACYSLVTLTARTCPYDDLGSYLSQMQTAWQALINQRWAKQCMIGWARAIEATYSDRMHALHPHYHMVLITDRRGDVRRIVDEWLRQCQKRGLVADVKAQDISDIKSSDKAGTSFAGAICEVYKYTVKTLDLLSMPLGALRGLAVGLAGKRLVSFGGLIKQLAKELDADNLDEADEPGDNEPIKLCTHCGSQKLDELSLKWSLSGNRYVAMCSDDATAADDLQRIIDNACKIRDKEDKEDED